MTGLTWRGLVAAGLWFGILHIGVQVILYRQPLVPSPARIAVGVLLFITASILKWTGNAWGMLVFWTVSNS